MQVCIVDVWKLFQWEQANLWRLGITFHRTLPQRCFEHIDSWISHGDLVRATKTNNRNILEVWELIGKTLTPCLQWNMKGFIHLILPIFGSWRQPKTPQVWSLTSVGFFRSFRFALVALFARASINLGFKVGWGERSWEKITKTKSWRWPNRIVWGNDIFCSWAVVFLRQVLGCVWKWAYSTHGGPWAACCMWFFKKRNSQCSMRPFEKEVH